MKLLNRNLKSKLCTIMPLLLSAVVLPSSLHAEVLEKNEDGKWQSVEQDHDKDLTNTYENKQSTSQKKPLKLVANDDLGQEFSVEKQAATEQNVHTKTKFKQSVVLHKIEQFDIAQIIDVPQQIQIIGLNGDSIQDQKIAGKDIHSSVEVKSVAAKKTRKKIRSSVKNKRQTAQKPVANKIIRSNRIANAKFFTNNLARPLNLNAIAGRRRSLVQPIILAAARQYNVDANLVDAMMWQESRYRASAHSHVGAIGLMQLMPATARELGVNPYDNWQNVFGGVAYLKKQLNRFGGDISLALAAYNAGPGAVRRYRGIPPYRETRNYVKSILKRYNSTQLQIVNRILHSRVIVNPFLNNARNTLRSDNFFTSLNHDFNTLVMGYDLEDNANQPFPGRKEEDKNIKFAMNRSEQTNDLPTLPFRKI